MFKPENAMWINCLGECFYKSSNRGIYRVLPETGEIEKTGLQRIAQVQADLYWSADNLKLRWEELNGVIPDTHLLIPAIPFVFGGEYDVGNLACVSSDEAFAYYKTIREQIKALADGTNVIIEVTD